MLVRDYINQFNITGNITFIKAEAREDAHTPYYHPEYRTLPIYHVSELDQTAIKDYIVLNNAQHPIDWLTGANWGTDFERGTLASLLVISNEDLELLYRDATQREDLIRGIEKRIKER